MCGKRITLLAMLLESQSNPSYSPSPEVAHVLCMYLRKQEIQHNKSSQRFKQQTTKQVQVAY